MPNDFRENGKLAVLANWLRAFRQHAEYVEGRETFLGM